MVSVDRVPGYLAETLATVARIQEQTTPEEYAALASRARRLVERLFTIEVNLDSDLMARVALHERLAPARARQAILMVATWKLIRDLAEGWSVRKTRPVKREMEAAFAVR